MLRFGDSGVGIGAPYVLGLEEQLIKVEMS
jgi:hypothetical protein